MSSRSIIGPSLTRKYFNWCHLGSCWVTCPVRPLEAIGGPGTHGTPRLHVVPTFCRWGRSWLNNKGRHVCVRIEPDDILWQEASLCLWMIKLPFEDEITSEVTSSCGRSCLHGNRSTCALKGILLARDSTEAPFPWSPASNWKLL